MINKVSFKSINIKVKKKDQNRLFTASKYLLHKMRKYAWLHFTQRSYMLLFSHPVMSESLWPCGLQSTLPCPSPSPEVCPSSCPLIQWCHPASSSSDPLFSFCLQSFLASGTFPMSQLFTLNDQNTGVSALASALPMIIQGWFPLRLTGLTSLLSTVLSGVFSNTIVQRHQFFGTLPSLQSSSYNHTCPLGRP